MDRVNWMYSLIMERTKSQPDSVAKVSLQQRRGKWQSLVNQDGGIDLQQIRKNIKAEIWACMGPRQSTMLWPTTGNKQEL